jgi:hypothetical protein
MVITRKPPQPIRIPIPGLKQSIGLGNTVKRMTSALGIRPCGGCQRRASALDRMVVLTPPRWR